MSQSQGYVIPVTSVAARPTNLTGTPMEENIRNNFSKLIDGMRSSLTTFNSSVSPYADSFVAIFEAAKTHGGRIASDFSKTIKNVRDTLHVQRIKGDVDSYNVFTQTQIDEFEKLERDIIGLDMTHPYDTIRQFVDRHRAAIRRLFIYEFYRLGKPQYLSAGMMPREYPRMTDANFEVLVYLLIYTPGYDLTYTPFGTNISNDDAEMFITTGNPNVLIHPIEQADQGAVTYEGGPLQPPEQFRPTGIFVDPHTGVRLNAAISRSQKAIIISICQTMITSAVLNNDDPAKIERARGMLTEFDTVAVDRIDGIVPELNLHTVNNISHLLDFSAEGVYSIYNRLIASERKRR
jgi:hypothetical protein